MAQRRSASTNACAGSPPPSSATQVDGPGPWSTGVVMARTRLDPSTSTALDTAWVPGDVGPGPGSCGLAGALTRRLVLATGIGNNREWRRPTSWMNSSRPTLPLITSWRSCTTTSTVPRARGGPSTSRVRKRPRSRRSHRRRVVSRSGGAAGGPTLILPRSVPTSPERSPTRRNDLAPRRVLHAAGSDRSVRNLLRRTQARSRPTEAPRGNPMSRDPVPLLMEVAVPTSGHAQVDAVRAAASLN